MANISLKALLEAEDFQARSKQTGKLVHFKSKDSYQAALKAGTHEDPNAKKGGTSKGAAKSNDMFGGDYAKDRGAEAPKDDSNWMDDLDSIDVSDIKGKADPNADSFTSGDLYGATFKDPQTGKTITVGDAYEREDDSPAYQKAFAYVSKFDPDKEAVMGTQAYDDLNKQAKPDGGFGYGPENDRTPATSLPKKASQLDDKHASVVEDTLNKETGLDGIAQIDDNTGAIMFNASKGDMPTYTLYVGSNVDYGKPNEFRVSMESTYGNDPAGLEDAGIDKSFKTAEEAMAFAAQVAKKYKKELEMDDDTNESSKYVTEGVSPKEMDAIKSAVQAASSFMGVGSELKKLGMKYTFATEPLPIYIIQPTPNNKVAIVNKKYASKPDFVHGDIAVGVMEGKTAKSVNEGRAFINAARKAKNEGLTEFEFNGKKYPVTIKD
jgi:hypothetical protein